MSIQVVLLSCLIAGAVSTPAGFNRFVVVPRTISTTVTTTVVTESTTPTTTVCYATAAGAAACRRRREILEQIEASAPIKMTATAAPTLEDLDTKADPAPANVDVQIASSIQSTEGFAEVVINDMEAICKGRGASPLFGGLAQAFGITVLTTTTFSSTSTSTKFVPSVTTKTVTVNCDPAAIPILIKKCA